MRFAAIDLGGSFIKSALADAETLEHVHRTPFPAFLEGLDPSFREVSLPSIAAAFDEHVERLLPYRPEALFISTQMHGFVLGERYISWQDQRSLASHFDELKARIEDPVRIGNEIGPGHAATVLFSECGGGVAALEGKRWLGHRTPKRYRRASDHSPPAAGMSASSHTTTWFFPSDLAWYMATSARRRSSFLSRSIDEIDPASGANRAMPMETDRMPRRCTGGMLKPHSRSRNVVEAMVWRISSQTPIPSSSDVPGRIITNSSPP